MSDQDDYQRTLSDADLVELPFVDRQGGAWGEDVPQELEDALSCLSRVDPWQAEKVLEPFLDTYGDAPEIWWALAVAMAGQDDLTNASTCYENFRDRVEIGVAMAQQEFGVRPAVARSRLRRLSPSLMRCRDHRLAATGFIMASGLELAFSSTGEAWSLLGEAQRRLRSIWPRPWGLLSEWLASVAVALAEHEEGCRPERSLRLALRFACREPENQERIAIIARDLGHFLSRADRLSEAEMVFGLALVAANAGASIETRASIAIAQAENLRSQRRYADAFERLEYALSIDLPDRLRAFALLAGGDMMARLGSAHRDRRQIEGARQAAGEAVFLLDRAGLDPTAAVRDRGLAEAMLGQVDAARRSFFALLRAEEPHRLTPAERIALAYLAYLIRMGDGSARKALGWAEYRLRTFLRSKADRPRDMILLREHCIAAAERLGDIATVRRHAPAMLAAEAAMLRTALGEGRGPAEWNRLRIAREALSILAAMEGKKRDEGAGWRRVEALLGGRGVARAARRALRRGSTIEAISSIREFAGRLAPGEMLLGLVSLHPPAPVDPQFPWASGFSAPRAIAIRITGSDEEPAIIDLGDYVETVKSTRRWSRDLAIGRVARVPVSLEPVAAWLLGGKAVFVIAEGPLELVPVRLLAAGPVIHQISGVGDQRDIGLSTAPLLLVASDMLVGTYKVATEGEIASVRSAFADSQLHISGDKGLTGALELLARRPRYIHIVAHGTAVLDPRATDLDVYQGAAVAFAEHLLTASHVADLHLEGVELVILSACDTAAGAAQHAEGSASMAAAFLDAGAAAVIATL